MSITNIFNTQIDFLAIGDIATDAFIKLKDAHVTCQINRTACEICMKFGDKVPFESVTEVIAVGNSANASVSASRLGLTSALVTNIGKDWNGKNCMESLKNNGVNTKYVSSHNMKTNYHYVLWFGDERTILVKHEDFPYSLPHIKPSPKWIYLSSLGSGSAKYHKEIEIYLEAHPEVKLCFQPGTFQMKLGTSATDGLGGIYKRTNVLVVNVEEAQRILGKKEEGSGWSKESPEGAYAVAKDLAKGLAELGPKLVLVTDGPKGAYMYDPEYGKFWYMPIYPDPKAPYERTGCGDAFASTFISALSLGKTNLEALIWAPINPMSVVQYIGAQEGLLKRDALEKLLKDRPVDYEPVQI